MGFVEDAQRLAGVWRSLYDARRGHRLPRVLLHEAPRAIPAVVDEICFQPRRNLAETALASVIRFSRDDDAAIRRGALRLARGQWPADLPPRFIVSASGQALEAGADIPTLSRLVIANLSRPAAAAGSAAPTSAAA
jgi:hypothetical protein